MNDKAPLKSREFERLVRRWGFVPEGVNGGHAFYRYRGKGKRIVSSASGRDHVPLNALKIAAKILGVSMEEFLQGPPRN